VAGGAEGIGGDAAGGFGVLPAEAAPFGLFPQAGKWLVATLQFTAVMRASPGEVLGDQEKAGRLCAMWHVSKDGKAVRMPNKIQAVDRLCRMMGWDQPMTVEDEADPLMELLESIRAGRRE